MAQIYLSLGTNLGDREENLRAAVGCLASGGVVQITAVSSIFETEPVGYTAQPLFLNIAAAGETSFAPHALLYAVKNVERKLGRTPTFRWGPRLIDIDILFYNGERIETAELTLPHPRLSERGFVIIPLAEIAPDLLLPAGITVRRLAENYRETGGVRCWKAWAG